MYRGMGRLSENSIINIKKGSHTVTADITVPHGRAHGVIIARGGAFGGSLYLKDGNPKYCYNLLGLARYTVTGDTTLTPGPHQLGMEFTYDGGGLAKGGP